MKDEISTLLKDVRAIIDGEMDCHTPEYRALDMLERAIALIADRVSAPLPELNKKCTHVWVANSGAGGEPKFKKGLSDVPTMHIKCSSCGDRTWVSEPEWYTKNPRFSA